MPNRYSAYLAAGLPVAVQDGAMPAMQSQLESLGVGLVYRDLADLVSHLPCPALTGRVIAVRRQVTFDALYPGLEAFIRACL